MKNNILVINPGSTSTKVSIFEDSLEKHKTNIDHSSQELESFDSIVAQLDYRKDKIQSWIKQVNYNKSFSAIVGRGGLLRSIPSGTYIVSDFLKNDLINAVQGAHASNLGGLIASSIAKEYNVDAFIVDPVAVDEFEPISRISGLNLIERKSLLHALNVRANAIKYSKEENKKLEELNLVIAHLGGGISIVPFTKGKMIDANNANEMGPFSPERSGDLPVGDIAKMIYDNKFKDYKEFKRYINGSGGLVSYLNTNDLREVQNKINNNDSYALEVLEAMAYQISKEIGRMSSAIIGDIDAIILTGGAAYSELLVDMITKRVEFISNVKVYPGEDEMKSLAEGVIRVLTGEEKEKIYEDFINDK